MVDLVTKRLRISSVTAVPPAAVMQYMLENRHNHAPWEPKREEVYYELQNITQQIASAETDLSQRRYVMLEQAGDQVVGTINFTNISGHPFCACYLGFTVAARLEGKGYMREALHAIIPEVFECLGLNRVMSNFIPRNFRSARLLSSLGFEVEGFAKEYLCIAGTWEDHILTSLRRSGLSRLRSARYMPAMNT
jgi:ribosomal-protein-alanine N-acetyltransferase